MMMVVVEVYKKAYLKYNGLYTCGQSDYSFSDQMFYSSRHHVEFYINEIVVYGYDHW